jgi:hypothetical protein
VVAAAATTENVAVTVTPALLPAVALLLLSCSSADALADSSSDPDADSLVAADALAEADSLAELPESLVESETRVQR